MCYRKGEPHLQQHQTCRRKHKQAKLFWSSCSICVSTVALLYCTFLLHNFATPLLLTTLTEETLFSSSCLMLNSSESPLSYFHFIMCQTFSTCDKSGLQTGQFSTRTAFAVCICAECVCHCLSEISSATPEDDNVYLVTYVVPKPFSNNGAVTNVQITHHAVCTKASPSSSSL